MTSAAFVPTDRLSASARTAALADMSAQQLDILVIGGGIVGSGAALDAATRGLRVGLVEAQDFASGTSSKSSKLVHGGIRYLEQLDFHLVQEALTERGLLLKHLAPHLVKPIRFLYPTTHPVWERAYIGAGMMLYDGLSYSGGGTPGVPHHKHMSKRQIEMASPSIKKDALVGGMYYYDGRVDDAKYVVNLVRTASHHGARVANRTKVESFLREGDRVVGVVARDLETGKTLEIRARQIINATGVWTGETQKMVGEDAGRLKVRASKGVHILIDRDKFKSTMGLLLRTEKSVLFVIPWGRFWIVGTTDTDWNLDLAHPVATAADIDYILDHINAVIDEPITHADIVGTYAGLRPLLASKDSDTTKLSREHVVAQAEPGLVLIAGGKWTTYRVMAKDVVDAAVANLPEAIAESITRSVPLLGAAEYKARWNQREKLATDWNVSLEQVEHLLNRYGSMANEVAALIAENPALAKNLPGSRDYLAAEALYAARFEGALHLEDVLARRTRMSFEARDGGAAAAVVVADLLAAELGWSSTQAKKELGSYLAVLEADGAARAQADDQAAEKIWHAISDGARVGE
jgi:glycerol-3-phosphate dehydrogenase